MKIAAHISSQHQHNSILRELLICISKKNIDCETLLFSDEEIKDVHAHESFVKIALKPSRKLGMFIWNHYTLPALLKKNKPSLFITEYGYTNNKMGITDYLFFSHENFAENKLYASKKMFLKALNSCKKIFVTADFMKNILIEKHNVPTQKILTIHYQNKNNNSLLGNDEKQKVKDAYTDGIDYFLFEINKQSEAYIMNVVKAFSQFKKWQKSSIKMLFLVEDEKGKERIKDFGNYKYKEELFFVNKNKTAQANIVGAAFLLIYFSAYTVNNIAFSAMQNNVPVIAADTDINRSLFANAVIYAANTDASIAAQIQFLYKDEYANKALQLEAAEFLKKYDTEKAIELFYEEISNQ